MDGAQYGAQYGTQYVAQYSDQYGAQYGTQYGAHYGTVVTYPFQLYYQLRYICAVSVGTQSKRQLDDIYRQYRLIMITMRIQISTSTTELSPHTINMYQYEVAAMTLY